MEILNFFSQVVSSSRNRRGVPGRGSDRHERGACARLHDIRHDRDQPRQARQGRQVQVPDSPPPQDLSEDQQGLC